MHAEPSAEPTTTPPPGGPSEPLGQVLVRSMSKRTFSPRTHRAYVAALGRFCDMTRVRAVGQLASLTSAALEENIHEACERWSRATVKLAVVVAARVWRQLHREQRVVTSPFHGIERIRIGDNVPAENVLRPGELQLVLDSLAGADDATPWLAFALLGLHGLRSHEALGLRWEDLAETPEGLVMTFKGKGEKEARIRVRPEVAGVLHGVRADGAPTGPVLAKAGRRFSYSKLYVLVCDVTKRVVGHEVSPHGLRATFVSEVIGRRGIEAARQLARHASIVTTQRYSRWAVLDDN